MQQTMENFIDNGLENKTEEDLILENKKLKVEIEMLREQIKARNNKMIFPFYLEDKPGVEYKNIK